MSYYVIKGPAGNGQYLGGTVCDDYDYGCPQWRGTLKQAERFPEPESAWKWLDAIQRKHPDAWYQGRVVRVNTLRDWKAEREQLRADRDHWRTVADLRRQTIERLGASQPSGEGKEP